MTRTSTMTQPGLRRISRWRLGNPICSRSHVKWPNQNAGFVASFRPVEPPSNLDALHDAVRSTTGEATLTFWPTRTSPEVTAPISITLRSETRINRSTVELPARTCTRRACRGNRCISLGRRSRAPAPGPRQESRDPPPPGAPAPGRPPPQCRTCEPATGRAPARAGHQLAPLKALRADRVCDGNRLCEEVGLDPFRAILNHNGLSWQEKEIDGAVEV
jgi:hypothetical protein